MPLDETLTPRDRLLRAEPDDALGLDRAARALLRTLVRLGPGALAHVQGAPGSGKSELLRRCLYQVESAAASLGQDAYTTRAVWFNAGAYAHHGLPLVGLVAAVARSAALTPSIVERARDLTPLLARVRFHGAANDGAVSLDLAETELLDRLRRAFAALVDAVRGSSPGRVLVLVTGIDAIPAGSRLSFLEGVRALSHAAPEAAFVVAVGREAAFAAVRSREGTISEAIASRIVDELCDVSISVPKLEVRRIGALLRWYVGPAEDVVTAAFGPDAMTRLTAAAARRSIGGPRFLERLAARVALLAEFALEARMVRELTESHLAWVVLSERWAEFRRFMIRGGRDRWLQLKHTVSTLGADGMTGGGAPDLEEWIARDLILADYLRAYGDGFETDLQGIYWVDDVMLQAGL
jgi:hypothetical protein